jgi:hypothetical protein
MVVVVRMVQRPPVGYVGVGSGATAEDFLRVDFGDGFGNDILVLKFACFRVFFLFSPSNIGNSIKPPLM